MNFTRSAGGWLALLTIFALSPALAQHHGSGPAESHSPGAPSPYAGMQQRRIKALSDQQVGDLQAGRGMGLALAAELNGYPGPMHVLELADALKLSDEQRSRTRGLIEAMKEETIPIGEKLIAEETVLDRLFAEQRVTRGTLDETTTRTPRRRANCVRHTCATTSPWSRCSRLPRSRIMSSCAVTRSPAITAAGAICVDVR